MRLLLMTLVALSLVLAITTPALAQTPTIIGPNSKLVWDLPNVDAATASSLTYLVTIDGAAAKAFTGVACALAPAPAPSGTSTCTAPLSQIPTGSHSLTVASQSGTLTSTATPFAYVTLMIPIPTNIRVQGDDD